MSDIAIHFPSDVVIPGEKKLRPICKELGLSQKGSKVDLVHRLTTYGLTLAQIVDRTKHSIAPTPRNSADEWQQLRQQSANPLPPSINDVPGEKWLRKVCKRFGLKQYGTKVDLVKRLLGHGLSFGDIMASSDTPALPSPSSSSNVVNTIGTPSPTLMSIDADEYDEEVNFIRETERLDAPEGEIITPPPSPSITEPFMTLPEEMIFEEDSLPSPTSNVSYGGDVLMSAVSVVAETIVPSSVDASLTCNICGKIFTRKGNVTRHMKSIHHLGENARLPCSVCGSLFTRNDNLHQHMLIHMPSPAFQCHLCEKIFVLKRNLQLHVKTHSDGIQPEHFDGKIVALNRSKDAFEFVDFAKETHDQEILHIVCIPWFDNENNYVNVSVGFTKFADVVHYARKIWKQIEAGINDGRLYLTGCGSGILAAKKLNWSMRPDNAFPLKICAETRVVANRIKGQIRALLDSVFIMCPEDKNNFVRPVLPAINKKVKESLNSMCQHNVNAFHTNLNGSGQQCSFLLKVLSKRTFNFEELDIDL